ncbi:hypothetical protein TSOC_011129 [Tetrabaena socialis]|uniref:Uncharacterized protein n=1 Tax=Tetrabaena socialis TaxID=47790 RepID=A0A2J7ZRF1_9CHLO|nr:hypothetical protein TSOC_011129 [Tetrabaena socialis]|eukprot:PNH02847.1 hypothetical protein TSOC_011129 [Tetrabaena socialis]
MRTNTEETADPACPAPPVRGRIKRIARAPLYATHAQQLGLLSSKSKQPPKTTDAPPATRYPLATPDQNTSGLRGPLAKPELVAFCRCSESE